MLKIGEFSKLSRVSVRMLRHYDEIGLLPPASIDSATGYRYYSEDQLPVAGRITALRDMGFGLGEIQACQQGRENPQVLAALFSARREALRGELAALRRQLRLLDTLEQRLRKEDSNMEYPVNLKTLPQRQVASVRTLFFGASVVLHYGKAVLEKQRVTATFKRYAAPEIVDEILRQGTQSLELGGKLTQLAVLFVDIQNANCQKIAYVRYV